MSLSRVRIWPLVVLLFVSTAALSQSVPWIPLGPDGGDARSLTYDPSDPSRIYLGTSAGDLFLSGDGGAHWSRFVHLGENYDYVLDNIDIHPKQPQTIYVGAWSVEGNGGGVFKSTDGGKTWQELPGMKGKSVRAMAIAPSDPNAIVAGTLTGVFRSLDAGATWQQISPASQAEIKNIESVAFDPTDVNVVYAGTWHLPWKTADGGRTWENIKQGIIDDSDVFSIIIDEKNPATVYLSACSGIYKSDSAGSQFHKVQGIPFSARRTRVLQQDPSEPAVIYAGTTEGLWRTRDAGSSWARISPVDFTVNDVLVDPHDSKHIMVATDRTGVLVSHDGGSTFEASNHGFAHRQVTSVVADNDDPQRLFTSLLNNREFGGVFASTDGGSSWSNLSKGLGSRDIFSLAETDKGTLLAGTNQGVFAFEKNASTWKPMNLVLTEKVTTVRGGKGKTKTRHEWRKSELNGRVRQIRIAPRCWYAATSQGLFRSLDDGHSWTGGDVLDQKDFLAVDALGDSVLAATPNGVMLSQDGGASWSELKLPLYVERVFNVALEPEHIWIMTHKGAFRSTDHGATWQHIMVGEPLSNLSYIGYDAKRSRLLAVAGKRNQIFASQDGGDSWTLTAQADYPVRNVAVQGNRLLLVTDFDGVVAQPVSQARLPEGTRGK